MSPRIRAELRDLWWFRGNVPCLDACPVKTDAGRYVQLIAQGRFAEAYHVARAPNPIASMCGRACGAPCEDACRRGKIDAPVAIRSLKRFVTENYGPESLSATALADVLRGESGGGSVTPLHGDVLLRDRAAPERRRIAVIGAGPAGLACAHDLALRGHSVTIFEAMPYAGGMMRYDIPSYRLPREVIDHQVAEIEAMGVEIRYGSPLTPTFGIGDLRAAGYEAVFLGIGAARGRGIELPGADLDGVVKAVEYLLNVNRGYRVPVGKRVVVVGGGLVAIDAARMAMRAIVPGIAMAPEEEAAVAATVLRVALDAAREAVRRGAAEVTVVSLESAAEMPAARSVQGREELEAAASEGITFLPAWGPKRVLGADGKVAGIELVRCVRTLDDDGRFHPIFDDRDTRTIAADAVILAIGQAPDVSFLRPEDDVEVSRSGTIKVDPLTLATTAPGVFAGGDGAFPPALLITAAAQGKVAARSIDAFLRQQSPPQPVLAAHVEQLPTDTYRMSDGYERLERSVLTVPLGRRSGITETEVPYTATQAREQASRCLECHTHPIYDGERCVLCNRCVDICPEHCLRFALVDDLAVPPDVRERIESDRGPGPFSVFLYDGDTCIRCGLCAVRCPTAAITMERFRFEEVLPRG